MIRDELTVLVGQALAAAQAAGDLPDFTAPEVQLEASGGLTLATARSVGETGVDLIAVGELTHSARVLDLGLDLRADD